MIDIETVGGDWWPKADVFCREAVRDEIGTVAKIAGHCRHHRTAVQAGANVGLFPRELRKHFDRVIAFEPYLVNAICAEMNLKGAGVELWLAALGEKLGRTAVMPAKGHTDVNCGAVETCPGGMIPVLTIDSLELEVCDLIWLDIEGDEPAAIMGAAETIARCRPVIVLEDKGLCRRHGIAPETVRVMVADRGYAMAGKLGNDLIMLPAEQMRKAA